MEVDPPGFTEGSSTTRQLPESARSGDPVENPVRAINPVGSAFTYSLSGEDSSLFTVDQGTGQLRVGEGVSLEEGRRYRVRLSATSTLQGGGSVTFSIDVTVVVVEPRARHYDTNGKALLRGARRSGRSATISPGLSNWRQYCRCCRSTMRTRDSRGKPKCQLDRRT